MTQETPVDAPLEVELPTVCPTLAPGQDGPPVGDGDGPLALIIYHGMGQQLPFETADLAVEAVRAGAAQCGGEVKDVAVRQATLGELPFTRVEMTLAGTEGRPDAQVHVYECYWAPLTEGRITLSETAAFLLDAGRRGLQFSLAKHPFPRWMFGRVQQIIAESKFAAWQVVSAVLLLTTLFVLSLLLLAGRPVTQACVAVVEILALYGLMTLLLRRTARYLLFALLVVLSLVALNSTIGLIAATFTLRGGGDAAKQWPSQAVRDNLTADLLTGIALMGLFGVLGVAVPEALRRVKKLRALPGWARIVFRVFTGALLFTLIATAAASLYDSFLAPTLKHPLVGPVSAHWVGPYSLFFHHADNKGGAWLYGAVWGPAFWLARYASAWLVQYMGDVAIYVSAHRLNKFADVRRKIRKVASDVTCAVFSALDPTAPTERPQFLYREVLVVAHSLGSVIAYDALCAATTEGLMAKRPWRVTERTRLLLTFGSPLDKIAFIFRSQGEQNGGAVREGMAASVQPLIVDQAFRPNYWVNLWSPDDWISGDLTFFDPVHADPQELPARKWVRNKADPQACTPAACHSDYWDNDALPCLLFRAVTAPDKAALEPYLPGPGDQDAQPLWVPKQRREHIERQDRLDKQIRAERKAALTGSER